jgi:hypothetical protein
VIASSVGEKKRKKVGLIFLQDNLQAPDERFSPTMVDVWWPARRSMKRQTASGVSLSQAELDRLGPAHFTFGDSGQTGTITFHTARLAGPAGPSRFTSS